MAELAALVLAALPQTQCTRCGYLDCAAYARAIAQGEADINQCPPGGTAGIVKLATLLNRPWHSHCKHPKGVVERTGK